MNLSLGIDIPLLVTDFMIILKGFYVLGLFLYLIFAVVVVKQVQMMTEALSGVLLLPIKPLAWFHLFASLVVFVLAVFLL